MKKFTLPLNICVFFSVAIISGLFISADLPEEQTVFVRQLLMKCHDTDAVGSQMKRVEINVTNTGFCRYRRVFSNGKEEYFSFNLMRFKDSDFYGSEIKGELYLRTVNDDVIVQIRNDRRGEIDSTGTYMVIPLKDITIAQLNQLSENLKKMRELLIFANK